MRCNQASTIALISHPKYKQNHELLDDAAMIAEGEIRKHFEFGIVADLPVSLAKKILEAQIPKILKIQRANGLWKIEDAERKSFWLLSVLQHAGLLGKLLTEKAFHHNPFAVFQQRSDIWGYVIRQEFSCSPLNTDPSLRQELVSGIYHAQKPNGSWENTLVLTCKKLEELCLLGENSQQERILQAVEWLFSMLNQDLEGVHGGVVYGKPGHNMFSTPDRQAEFKIALRERPEWDPKQLCYNHLAIIQNGITIQTLIRLGYSDDERVEKACDNLYFLKEKYGGWCQSNIMQGLAYKRWVGRKENKVHQRRYFQDRSKDDREQP
jgi:hypothetical protein